MNKLAKGEFWSIGECEKCSCKFLLQNTRFDPGISHGNPRFCSLECYYDSVDRWRYSWSTSLLIEDNRTCLKRKLLRKTTARLVTVARLSKCLAELLVGRQQGLIPLEGSDADKFYKTVLAALQEQQDWLSRQQKIWCLEI